MSASRKHVPSKHRRLIIQGAPVAVASSMLAACGGGGGGGATGGDGVSSDVGADELAKGGKKANTSPAPTPVEPAPAPAPAPAPVEPAPAPAPVEPAPAPVEPAPAPAPAIGTAIVVLHASSASGTTGAPFCVGQVFRQGDVPSGSDVVADLAEFQSVVKNRWPDGSVKFAVLSGRVTVGAGVTQPIKLARGTAAGGAALTLTDLVNARPDTVVQFSGIGSVSLRDLLNLTSTYNSSTKRWSPGLASQWISGPQMSSWLFRSHVGTDAHLVAWFEVRLWKSGAVQVLPWLENGYMLVDGPTSKHGAASVSVNGAQVFHHDFQTPYASDNSTTITGLPHHCRAALVSGGSTGYWMGIAAPSLRLAHDTAYLQQTRLVPAYFGNTAAGSSSLAGLPVDYKPMARLGYSSYMPQTGAAAAIGLLPKWDAMYLTSKAHPRALDSVVAHGFAAGRFGTHYRDENTGRPARFSQHPHRCYRYNQSSIRFTDPGAASMPANSGSEPATRDQAHHPSVGFMPYLVTGLFYFMEETQFQATHNYFSCGDSERKFAAGVLTPEGYMQIRSAAWSLRTLFNAAAVTPDDDILRGEFMKSVEENASYYHNLYVAGGNSVSPLGYLRITGDYISNSDGRLGSPIWQDSFFTASWGWLIDMNLPLSSTGKTRLTEFFAWKAKAVVTLLGDPNDPNAYPFVDAGRYDLQVGTPDLVTLEAAAMNWGLAKWFTTGRQIWDATRLSNASATDSAENSILQPPGNTIRGGYFPSATGYLGNLMPAIAYAVEHGVPGAAAGYARLKGATNWWQFVDAVNDEPMWGVRPRNA